MVLLHIRIICGFEGTVNITTFGRNIAETMDKPVKQEKILKKSETCPPNKAKILNKMWTCQLNGKKIEDMVDKAIKKVKILH